MAVDNRSGLSYGWCVGHVPPHPLSATFIVKGTFQLSPGRTATPAPKQAKLAGDVEDEAGPRYPSDFAWLKPRADVLLVGTCRPPKPTSVCRVSFQVGSWSKQLAVVGDRVLTRRLLIFKSLSDPEPFASMPLSYARAYGGSEYPKNPFGRLIPNLMTPNELYVDTDSRPDPAGFGPIAPAWPQRRANLGTYGEAWRKKRWPGLPADFDWTMMNSAPPDQQFREFLRGDEKLVLENFHPDHRVYESRLPGVRARWALREASGMREVPMNLDTLWIDMDSETLVLVWRGVAPIRHPSMREILDHVIVSEPLSSPIRPVAPSPVLPVASSPVPSVASSPVLPVASSPVLPVAPSLLPPLAPSPSNPAVPPSLRPSVAPSLGPSVAPPTPMRRWTRDECRGVRDFRDQDLAGLDLSGLEFEGAIFAGAKMFGCRLERARLAGANFAGADLRGAVLRDADGSTADFTDSNLTAADLSGAKLPGAHLLRTRLAKANMRGIDGAGASFREADLSGADLREARLPGADMSATILSMSNLAKADLTGASLAECRAAGVNLEGANLAGVVATSADLSGARLQSAVAPKSVWVGAKLDGADFTRAGLQGANLTGASARKANFTSTDLRAARLMDAKLEEAGFLRTNLFQAGLEGAALRGANFVECNLYGAEFLNAAVEGAGFVRCDLTGTKLEARED